MTGLADKAQSILETAEQPSLCRRIGDGGKTANGAKVYCKRLQRGKA